MDADFDFDALEKDLEESLTLGMTSDEVVRTFYVLLNVAKAVGQGDSLWATMESEVPALANYSDAGKLTFSRGDPAWDVMADVLDECVPVGTDWLIDFIKDHDLPYIATWVCMSGSWVYITFGRMADIIRDYGPDIEGL